MNAMHNSFILEITYIFSYIFKYKLHIGDTHVHEHKVALYNFTQMSTK